jgi:hypothetical protein
VVAPHGAEKILYFLARPLKSIWLSYMSPPDRKLRSSSSPIDVDVKKYEQGTAAHLGGEIGKVESRCGFGGTIRYDTPTSFEG